MGHTVDNIRPLHFIRDQFGGFHVAQHRPDIGIHTGELLCLFLAANQGTDLPVWVVLREDGEDVASNVASDAYTGEG